MCSNCYLIGNRNGKRFSCENCGNIADADRNAACNIATWGRYVNHPEKPSEMCCSLHPGLGLKPVGLSPRGPLLKVDCGYGTIFFAANGKVTQYFFGLGHPALHLRS